MILTALTRASIRTMSTAAAPRHKFILYAPDMTDSEGFARRMSVRAKHLEKAGTLTEKGSLSASHLERDPLASTHLDLVRTWGSDGNA